jgi:hypothetical protein
VDATEETPTEHARDPVEFLVDRCVDQLAALQAHARGLRRRLRSAPAGDRQFVAIQLAAAARAASDTLRGIARSADLCVGSGPVTSEFPTVADRPPRNWKTIAVVLTAAAAVLGALAKILHEILRAH